MTRSAGARPPRMAGRLRELGLLESAIGRAADGEPSAVFVHGEAGVGKTRLVREACDRADEAGFTVVWGRCLRFGAVESSFLPWVTALDSWLDAADGMMRAKVLEAVPAAVQLLPSLGGRADDSPVRLVTLVDSLLRQIVGSSPTVLVMDDVQWADTASRDALTYVLAGFASERLLVLATYRDEEFPPGDPMHGWLADLRRLPSVSELRLGRLKAQETEQQLTLLLGGTPAPGLVAAVVDRSGGNPYLTELIARDVDRGAEALPDLLPADLADALLASWHRLGDVARYVVRVLAVAGRPTPIDGLARVCATSGIEVGTAHSAVVEANQGGIVVRTGADAVWFRHPLLAEVLYGTFLPGEAAPFHAAWASGLQSTVAVGVDEVRRLGDLALHLEGAHDLDGCFAASMKAADAARESRLWQEEAVHLRRATQLWPDVAAGVRGQLDEASLLERAAESSIRVGQDEQGLAAGQRALDLARAAGDPLATSRLMVWCADNGWWPGMPDEERVEQTRQAIELSRPFPDSPEHARALASLSNTFGWRGAWKDAAGAADEAVSAARRSGTPEALSDALGARGFAHQHADIGEADILESLRYARLSGDPELIAWSSQWWINALVDTGRLRQSIEVGEAALASALESGSLGAAIWHSATVADGLAGEGRLTDAASVVRVGLSLTGVTTRGAFLRLAAVLVAVRRGDLTAAALHLDRALEQVPDLEVWPGLEAPPKLAELLLARRRPAEAVDLLVRTMPAHSMDLRVPDSMLLWGARASADLAAVCRDRHDGKGARAAANDLHRLASIRDGLPGTPFVGRAPDDPVLAAWRAIRDAEISRCESASAAPELWEQAAELCERAGLGWEEHVARWRHAEYLVARGSSRGHAAVLLREVHRFASREGAARLRADVEALAAIARISLDEPQYTSRLPQQRPKPLAGLTPREEEVLSHLVAGRTYAEIAEALFVSEKTVSTHVSNLLRKTGTRSRQEVSALALRLKDGDDT